MFKFANLSRRGPLHKNANLKNVRRDSAVAPLERAVGLERVWERKGRRFVSRTPSSPEKKKKGALLLQLSFATAKQSVIQAPSPLTRKIKFMRAAKFNQTKFSIFAVQVSVSNAKNAEKSKKRKQMLEALSLNFMQNALLAGILVSIACGVIGTLTVINRMVFIAGGIAHGAYGGLGIAFYFSLEPLLGASLFSVFLALLIATITLKDKSKMDSVIGALWAFGMAFGIILTDLAPGYNVDLMSYLFGSILAVPQGDLIFMAVANCIILASVALFYRQFEALSFDAEFARLRGVRTTLLYYALTCMMALSVVMTIRAVGLILVIALLTIPPYIAGAVSSRLGTMMLNAALISAAFCVSGLWLSFEANLTSGASIILIASVCFFVFTAIKRR